MEISRQLTFPEGKTLEFKRNLSSPTPVLRTLVAFANTAGGTLIIGRADDGSVVGVDDVLAEEEQLAVNVPANVLVNVPVKMEGITERQQWFMGQLSAASNVKAADIEAHWNVVEKTAKRDIAELRKLELIEFVGAAKTGSYRLKVSVKLR